MNARFDPVRRGLLALGAAQAALSGAAVPRPARAQAMPDTLRVLCGSTAGSVPDVLARRLAEQLAGRAARGVVVENRTGASGQIAIDALRIAPADGATLLVGTGAYSTIYPYVYPKLSYDPDRDLAPAAIAAETSVALALGPAVPASVRSLGAFVDWARANPGGATYATPGAGTLLHLVGALLSRSSGVPLVHVPFRGGPPAIADALGGQVATVILPEGLLQPHHVAGRLRVVATSGAARTAMLPDVPTFAEQGRPDIVVREWFAAYLPGRASPEVVSTSAASLRAAIARPEFATAIAPLGLVPGSAGPAETIARIGAERVRWEPLIRGAGITADA